MMRPTLRNDNGQLPQSFRKLFDILPKRLGKPSWKREICSSARLLKDSISFPPTLYAIQLEPFQADTPFYHLLDPCARQLGSPSPDAQRLQPATTSDRGNRCAERRVEEQCVYA